MAACRGFCFVDALFPEYLSGLEVEAVDYPGVDLIDGDGSTAGVVQS